MNGKVKMVRTLGGELYIGCSEGVTDKGDLVLTDARVFSMQMTGNGQAGIAFIPVFPFSPNKKFDTISFTSGQLIVIADEEDIDGQIVNGYKSNVTGIDLSAAKPAIITPA